MSDWALEFTYETVGTSTGFTWPLTLNLYNVGAGDTVGSLIGSDTVNAFVPWRPEVSAFGGIAFQVTFDLGGLVVPDQIIYGLSYNPTDYSNPPTGGTPGPYDSLNIGLAVVPPSVGSNPLPDTVYWNSLYAGFYADGGAGGVGVFRQDSV